MDKVSILVVSKRWFWVRSLWKLLWLADLTNMHALCAIGYLSSQILTNSMNLSLCCDANNSRQSAYCPHFMKLEGKLPCSQQPTWWIQSTFTQIISLILILILSSHPHLRLPSSLFPSGFPKKTLQAHLSSPYVPHSLPSHSSWFDHRLIFGENYNSKKPLTVQLLPVFCCVVPLSPDIFLHIAFSNTLGQCASLKVTDRISQSTHKNTQHCTSMYFNPYVFR